MLIYPPIPTLLPEAAILPTPTNATLEDRQSINLRNTAIWVNHLLWLAEGARLVTPFAWAVAMVSLDFSKLKSGVEPAQGIDTLSRLLAICEEHNIDNIPYEGSTVKPIEGLRYALSLAKSEKPESTADGFVATVSVNVLYRDVASRLTLATHLTEVALGAWQQSGDSHPAVPALVADAMRNGGLSGITYLSHIIAGIVRPLKDGLTTRLKPSSWRDISRLAYPTIIDRVGQVPDYHSKSEGLGLKDWRLATTEGVSKEAQSRKIRRLAHSAKTHGTSLEDVESKTLTVIALELGATRMEATSVSHAFKDTQFRAVSFMREHAFEKFKVSQVTKTLWDLRHENHGTWHNAFSDAPDALREHTDTILYGEPAVDTVFGVYVDLNDKLTLKDMAQIYGPRVVVWDNLVLAYSTLTLNDSQLGGVMAPCTSPNLRKAKFASIVYNQLRGRSFPSLSNHEKLLMSVAHVIANKQFKTNRAEMVEVQIHSRLNYSCVNQTFLV